MEAIAPLLGRTLVMVAHPDDETIGCGALLQRMREPVVVFCTDGAPRDHYFWAKHGSRERYAEARMREAAAALEVLGVREFVFLSEEGSHLFIDQDLFLAIPQALQRVHELIDRYQPEALLTHAYEGGHPDHDTCCFMGSALAQERQLPAWEFPLYYREHVDLVRQQEFVEPGGSEVLLDVTMEELEQKRQMMAAHVSQTHAIAEFNLAIERFRPMAAYDFSAPPHPGVLNYEVWQWPMTGAQLVSAFQCYRDKRAHPEPGTRGPGVREVA